MGTPRVDAAAQGGPVVDSIREALACHYRDQGLADAAWHVGPEHPALERAALDVLDSLPSRRVVEVGFQAGGFAVPLVMALHRDPAFSYVGVDNLKYSNAVHPAVIEAFLRDRTDPACCTFVVSDSSAWLRTLPPGSVDLVLLDHFKPMYERDLFLLCRRRIVAPGGAILLHDVCGVAASAWRDCQHLVRAFGLAVEIRQDVPGGLAILRVPRVAAVRGRPTLARSWAIVTGRAMSGDAIRGASRAAGRLLRCVGLR